MEVPNLTPEEAKAKMDNILRWSTIQVVGEGVDEDEFERILRAYGDADDIACYLNSKGASKIEDEGSLEG